VCANKICQWPQAPTPEVLIAYETNTPLRAQIWKISDLEQAWRFPPPHQSLPIIDTDLSCHARHCSISNNCDVCANKICQWPQAPTPEVLIAYETNTPRTGMAVSTPAPESSDHRYGLELPCATVELFVESGRKTLVRGWKPPCLFEVGYLPDLEIYGPEGETTLTVALFDFK
jgi:hypothetical protein